MEPIFIAVGALLVAVAAALFFRSRRSSSTPVSDARTGAAPSLGAALRAALRSSTQQSALRAVEDVLLRADVGVEVTGQLLAELGQGRFQDTDEAMGLVADTLKAEFARADRTLRLSQSPAVILVVGVNGSGKTTTIAKLARLIQSDGSSVILGAADTFRAAASEQLALWGSRLGVRVVTGQQGGDPAAVAHDTLAAARANGADVAIIDTAGRLHAKQNLMAELSKIHRVLGGELVGEVLLVLDATAGQNGLAQVASFGEAVPVSGIVLSKLDGTARGGIVLAVERALGVPVKFVGVGEKVEDLVAFDPETFVDELLEVS